MSKITELNSTMRKKLVEKQKTAPKRSTPEAARAIEIACKRISFKALEVLENALDEVKTPNLEYRWRIAAAKEILDRAWGRPKQTVDANINMNASEEFLQVINQAKKRSEEMVVESEGEEIEAIEYKEIETIQ